LGYLYGNRIHSKWFNQIRIQNDLGKAYV
jgi:hypothetical protein